MIVLQLLEIENDIFINKTEKSNVITRRINRGYGSYCVEWKYIPNFLMPEYKIKNVEGL